ncbi:hypothetical protein CC85DRAFT_331507 [Cutaneotrichosporon oleaginosum]|uniref:Uncharacterized protein n=1 Tax=Cutaneotrichosporon oleaginosum TaxID=879819 RepID=A0A0J0XBW0_9TREE|nr:uncharacterized protein CC85DRAFT_331507 [Cutaneotrichosporon oleaginosum]KLT38558.1 hypothetical protein CC85DRAFT_331507 [Cutaneotrichosporon oleaginosum]TXT08480.1 hypothetical protein COLE_05404 [Cutaneotrichosporon oleaginosum]
MLATPRSMDSEFSLAPISPLQACVGLQDDTEWTAGDFEVITSDGVRFRVPSYYLLAASTLFHPHTAAAAYSITFQHGTETGPIFRLVLYLLTKGRLGSGEQWHVRNLQALASFLHRWQMEAALANFTTHFEARVRNRDQAVLGLPGFLVGAYADSVEACVATLRIPSVEWGGGRRQDDGGNMNGNGINANGNGNGRGSGIAGRPYTEWPREDRERRGKRAIIDNTHLLVGARGRPTFDPASWPLETFTAGHPPAYLFALARAWGSAGADDAARLPTEFVAFLQAAKAAGA